MRYEKNTSILLSWLAWLALGLSLNACAGGPVTKAEICIEIPFVDAPEGACAVTTTHEAFLVPPEKWADEKPFMLMIHAKYWTEIKKDWLKACRWAGEDCNVKVDSIDRLIKKLNAIGERFAAE